MTPLDGVPPSMARITEGGGKVVVSRVTKSESEGRCIFHHLLLNGKKKTSYSLILPGSLFNENA